MRFWAVFSLFFGVVRAQTNVGAVCGSIINSLDCKYFNFKPICASNGVQYNTECEFTKAHCLDANLKVLNEGPCPSGLPQGSTVTMNPATATATTIGPGTTVGPTAGMTTGMATGMTTDPNLSDLCNQIVNTVCAADDNPLCANDGNTYPNYCRFSQARCYQPGLQIAYAGACSGTDTFPPITTPTTTPRPPTIFEIICRTLEQVTCDDDGVQVCGSDGVTYPTACDFEKAKCLDITLTVKDC